MCVFTLLLFELVFVADSECFGVLALSSSFALASFRGWISFCLHDAKIMTYVWSHHSIAGGIRGGRCDAVPLVSIMLMLMRIVLF